jgi:hypothetical protein
MIPVGPDLALDLRAGLLVDTDLPVLFAVGTVNRNRIETFKRKCKYTKDDYDLLHGLLGRFQSLYTVPHVLAEVSNLTDLGGTERASGPALFEESISLLNEAQMASKLASEHLYYQDLGLVDAAIGAVARTQKCAVLTDDLYL